MRVVWEGSDPTCHRARRERSVLWAANIELSRLRNWHLRCLYQVASCQLLCSGCWHVCEYLPHVCSLFGLHLPRMVCFCKLLIVWRQLPLLLHCCEMCCAREWITAVHCLLRCLWSGAARLFISEEQNLVKAWMFCSESIHASLGLNSTKMLEVEIAFRRFKHYNEKKIQSALLFSVCVFTRSSARSCEVPSWNLWLTPFPSPSSSACWSSTRLTALRELRICQMRPSQTTHGKCSGSKPHSSPGQRCWSWNGCWVSLFYD